MNHISFFSAVTWSPYTPPTKGRSLLQTIDDYFCLNGDKYTVLPGYSGQNGEGVISIKEHTSQLKTAIKVASYFTLVIPAIALIAKLILRSIYTFYKIQFSNTSPLHASILLPAQAPAPTNFSRNLPPNSGNPSDPSSNINPALPTSSLSSSRSASTLEFDRKYRLSSAEVEPLKISLLLPDINHDIPKKSDAGYSYAPTIQIGKSHLYPDSFFEVDTCYSSYRSCVYYEIVRRRLKTPLKLIPFSSDGSYQILTTENIIDLKLLPINDRAAVSIRPEYSNSLFLFLRVVGTDNWQIRRLPFREGIYPYLPFNQAVDLSRDEFNKLCLTGSSSEVKGDHYTWTMQPSGIEEYENSVILYRRSDQGYCCVRMLKK